MAVTITKKKVKDQMDLPLPVQGGAGAEGKGHVVAGGGGGGSGQYVKIPGKKLPPHLQNLKQAEPETGPSEEQAPPPTVEAHAGVAQVLVKGPGIHKEEQVHLPPKILVGTPANVGLSAAFTKNLGNYESIKMQVSLHMPCDPEKIEETFVEVKEWVDAKMSSLMEEVTKDLSEPGPGHD